MTDLTRARIAWGLTVGTLLVLGLGTILSGDSPAGRLWCWRAMLGFAAIGFLLFAFLFWPPKRG